jgi:hypothetical protein
MFIADFKICKIVVSTFEQGISLIASMAADLRFIASLDSECCKAIYLHFVFRSTAFYCLARTYDERALRCNINQLQFHFGYRPNGASPHSVRLLWMRDRPVAETST